jgi:hypothetical protein
MREEREIPQNRITQINTMYGMRSLMIQWTIKVRKSSSDQASCCAVAKCEIKVVQNVTNNSMTERVRMNKLVVISP